MDSIGKFKTKFGQTISYTYVLLQENAADIIYEYKIKALILEKKLA